MKKLGFWGVLLLLALPAFGGQRVTVALDWYINPDHAPLLVAKTMGYFHQQGLDVHWITPTQAAAPSKLVAGGRADIAISYPSYWYSDLAAGMPLIKFANVMNSSLDCLSVLKSSHIQQLSQLRGKTIGYTGSSSHLSMLEVMLAHAHVPLQSVHLVDVKMNLVQALLTHRVDAVVGMMRNVEPVEMAKMGKPLRLFYPEHYGVPRYSELILLARKGTSVKLLKRFNTALQQGVDFLLKHPQKSWQLALKAYPAQLAPSAKSAAINHAIWMGSLPYFARHPGRLNCQDSQRYADFLLKVGTLRQRLDLCHHKLKLGTFTGS